MLKTFECYIINKWNMFKNKTLLIILSFRSVILYQHVDDNYQHASYLNNKHPHMSRSLSLIFNLKVTCRLCSWKFLTTIYDQSYCHAGKRGLLSNDNICCYFWDEVFKFWVEEVRTCTRYIKFCFVVFKIIHHIYFGERRYVLPWSL